MSESLSSSSEESYSNSSSDSNLKPDISFMCVRPEGDWYSSGNMPEKYLEYFCKKVRVDSAIVIPIRSIDDPYLQLLVSPLDSEGMTYSKVPVEFGRSERVCVSVSWFQPFYKVIQEYKMYEPIPLVSIEKNIVVPYVVVKYQKKTGLIKKKWVTKIKYFYCDKKQTNIDKFKKWFRKACQNNEKYRF